MPSSDQFRLHTAKLQSSHHRESISTKILAEAGCQLTWKTAQILFRILKSRLNQTCGDSHSFAPSRLRLTHRFFGRRVHKPHTNGSTESPAFKTSTLSGEARMWPRFSLWFSESNLGAVLRYKFLRVAGVLYATKPSYIRYFLGLPWVTT